MQPFRTTRRIEFYDTDMAGIVHFSNFFRFMEAAEVEFLRTRGISVRMDWKGQQIGLPRVSASCDYISPARFEDVLDVTVAIDRIGSKSITYHFGFSKEGKPVAKGRITCVCCRVNEDHRLEAIDIPPSLREALTAENRTAS